MNKTIEAVKKEVVKQEHIRKSLLKKDEFNGHQCEMQESLLLGLRIAARIVVEHEMNMNQVDAWIEVNSWLK